MLDPKVLRKKEDFTAVYKRGKSAGSKYVTLLYRKNGLEYSRNAFLASKKVGKSVRRNRARRLMKESYRELKTYFPPGYDYVFIAKSTIEGKSFQEVKESMETAISRAKFR